jgi:ribosomal protein S1
MSDVAELDPVESAEIQSISDLKRKMQVKGTVKRVELYGAFVDVGVGVDAIIHISQIGDQKGGRMADIMNVGDEVEVWIDKVDADKQQIILSMQPPLAVDWSDLEDGQEYTGKIVRLENFGAFVDIGAEKEGLVHVSELSHEFVKHPSQAVSTGDEVQVKVLSFSKRKRRINLSIKALLERPESAVEELSYQDVVDEIEDEPEEEMPTAMEFALRQAMGESADSITDGRDNRRSKKSRRRDNRRRRQQAEIISRTLRLSDD